MSKKNRAGWVGYWVLVAGVVLVTYTLTSCGAPGYRPEIPEELAAALKDEHKKMVSWCVKELWSKRMTIWPDNFTYCDLWARDEMRRRWK